MSATTATNASRFLFICILILITPGFAQRVVTHNNHSYVLIASPNVADARAHANANAGHLAAIQDSDESDVLRTILLGPLGLVPRVLSSRRV